MLMLFIYSSEVHQGYVGSKLDCNEMQTPTEFMAWKILLRQQTIDIYKDELHYKFL